MADELQIGYNQSYILTFTKYVASLEAKAARKQALLEDARLCKIVVEENKERRCVRKRRDVMSDLKNELPINGRKPIGR
jgi:hypothetical protein